MRLPVPPSGHRDDEVPLEGEHYIQVGLSGNRKSADSLNGPNFREESAGNFGLNGRFAAACGLAVANPLQHHHAPLSLRPKHLPLAINKSEARATTGEEEL